MHVLLQLLIAVLIAILPAVSIAAQEQEVYCGDLAAADCALLRDNQVADASLTSMRYEFEMTMTLVQDLPRAVPDRFSFSSQGALGYDKADVDAMSNEILDMTIREVLALLDDPDALADRIVGYVDRLAMAPDADLHIEVALPESMDEGVQTLSADFRMTDGVLYLTSPLLEMAEMPADTWVSLDLVQVTHLIADMLKDPTFVENMMSGMGGMGGASGPTRRGGEPEAMPGAPAFDQIMAIANAPYWAEMETPEFKARIETITRLEDAEIDGVPVAIFEDRVNMAAMAESEPFRQAFSDIFEMTAQDLPAEQRHALEEAVLDMLGEMDLVSTQAIGLEDHYTYRVDVAWEMTVDPRALMMAVMPEDEIEDMPEEALALQTQTFHYHQEIRDHDQPVLVTPPPEGHVVSLLAMLMSGSPE